jgi:hypothetical protein
MKRYVGFVTSARSMGELDELVRNLSTDGYRIVNVLKNDIGDYVIVAQRETHPMPDGYVRRGQAL